MMVYGLEVRLSSDFIEWRGGNAVKISRRDVIAGAMQWASYFYIINVVRQILSHSQHRGHHLRSRIPRHFFAQPFPGRPLTPDSVTRHIPPDSLIGCAPHHIPLRRYTKPEEKTPRYLSSKDLENRVSEIRTRRAPHCALVVK